jgi:alkylation response protein AidB-like acyl-CoA dehydrogenase
MFGGAGYVEDTGLPVLLRDSQVLPIWEGTTNVLALDTLRVKHGLKQIEVAVARCIKNTSDTQLANAARIARSALDHAISWLSEAERVGQPALEAGARRFALTLGRTMELALLIKHAQWSGDHQSARRFSTSAIDLITDYTE